MAINKSTREKVRLKFNGLCAYTGKPLDDKWQVDHIFPKNLNIWLKNGYEKDGLTHFENIDCLENLLPAIRRVNHYKREKDLEGFRTYMNNFHLRLAKLPKKTSLKSKERRIEYMNDIANLFGITVEKPFNGQFYFETNPSFSSY